LHPGKGGRERTPAVKDESKDKSKRAAKPLGAA